MAAGVSGAVVERISCLVTSPSPEESLPMGRDTPRVMLAPETLSPGQCHCWPGSLSATQGHRKQH